MTDPKPLTKEDINTRVDYFDLPKDLRFVPEEKLRSALQGLLDDIDNPESISNYGKTTEERIAINNYVKDVVKRFLFNKWLGAVLELEDKK